MRVRLATATRAREQAEQRLMQLLSSELHRREAVATELGAGRVGAPVLQEAQVALDTLAQMVQAQREQVRRAVMFEEEERAAAARAMSERKALDRLREQHASRERIAAGRREALVIDEIATANAWRQ